MFYNNTQTTSHNTVETISELKILTLTRKAEILRTQTQDKATNNTRWLEDASPTDFILHQFCSSQRCQSVARNNSTSIPLDSTFILLHFYNFFNKYGKVIK